MKGNGKNHNNDNDNGNGQCNGWGWEEQEGWNNGMERLSSAFMVAALYSYNLSCREIEVLADYCSLLSHCFRSIAVSEKWCRDRSK